MKNKKERNTFKISILRFAKMQLFIDDNCHRILFMSIGDKLKCWSRVN